MIDNSAFMFVIINNVLTTSALLQRAVHTPAALIVAPAVFFVALAILQRYASRRWPGAYYRNHTWILLFNRCIRLPTLPLLLYETRARCSDPTLHSQLRDYVDAGRHSSTPTVELFTATLASSGSLLLLLHASAAPLPFLPQLIVQAACGTVMLLCQSLPAAKMLARSPLGPTAIASCLKLNTLFEASSSAFGIFNDRKLLQATCERHSSQLLVTFAQLYFGLALPVCFAYRLQSHLLQYLRAACHTTSGASGGARGGSSSDRGELDTISRSTSTSITSYNHSSRRRRRSSSSSSSSYAPIVRSITSTAGGALHLHTSEAGAPVADHQPGATDAWLDEQADAWGWLHQDKRGWPHQADTAPRVLADTLVLAYLVPVCWVCAVVLRPVITALGWPAVVTQQ